MTELSVAGVNITSPKAQPKRFLGLLWGKAGCGKTTLAATMPGKKLWIAFDNDATSPVISQSDDIYLLDFSQSRPNVVARATNSLDNPLGLSKILDELGDVETIVLDSITTFSEKALEFSVSEVDKADMFNPTLRGYGRRKQYVARMMYSLINLTAQRGINLVFIGHEDSPSKDELTGVITVDLLIGGSLKSEAPIKLSEVWHVGSVNGVRKINVQPDRTRSMMKTRMFKVDGKGEFVWKFDPDTWTGAKMSDWLGAWKANDCNKIMLPK